VTLVLGSTVAAKLLLSVLSSADSHVFNILKAKLTDYEDFDTAMYALA